MIAVANASPICYLVLIGEIKLLPKLFREVLIPRPVIEELLGEGASAALHRLTRTSFRCSPALLKSVLERYAGR